MAASFWSSALPGCLAGTPGYAYGSRSNPCARYVVLKCWQLDIFAEEPVGEGLVASYATDVPHRALFVLLGVPAGLGPSIPVFEIYCHVEPHRRKRKNVIEEHLRIRYRPSAAFLTKRLVS